MTAKEFNKLKIGDSIYFPNRQTKHFTGSEVLEIDRFYKKVKVLLKSKFLSYKYFPVKLKPTDTCSCFCGTYKK